MERVVLLAHAAEDSGVATATRVKITAAAAAAVTANRARVTEKGRTKGLSRAGGFLIVIGAATAQA
jgi:hypothetical protein